MPTEVALVMAPGTTITSRPCERAASTVMSVPDPAAASTTTVTRASPLMRRFRRWKLPAVGRSPGGNSVSRSPSLAHPLVQDAVRGGIDDAEAVPQHADRLAARVERREVGHGVEAARHAADHAQPRVQPRPAPPAGRRRRRRRSDSGSRRPPPPAGRAVRGARARTAPPAARECPSQDGRGRRHRPGRDSMPPCASTSRSTRSPCATDVALMARGAGDGNPRQGAQKLERRREGAVGSRAGLAGAWCVGRARSRSPGRAPPAPRAPGPKRSTAVTPGATHRRRAGAPLAFALGHEAPEVLLQLLESGAGRAGDGELACRRRGRPAPGRHRPRGGGRAWSARRRAAARPAWREYCRTSPRSWS